jgi:hypothetical protein
MIISFHWESRSSPFFFFLSLLLCFMYLPHVCVTYCSLKYTCNTTCIVTAILHIPSSCQHTAKYSSSSQDTWRGSIKYLGKQTCLSANQSIIFWLLTLLNVLECESVSVCIFCDLHRFHGLGYSMEMCYPTEIWFQTKNWLQYLLHSQQNSFVLGEKHCNCYKIDM